MICCINGKFIREKEAKISIMDHGFLYSDGFYDTMKAFNGMVLDLDLHISRIKKSLKKLGLKLPWPMAVVNSWIQKIALINKYRLARVRLTVTRGCNYFNFSTCKKPTLVITAEPIKIDREIYNKGVSVLTLQTERILPEIKTLGLTAMILARRLLHSRKAFETIFVNKDGFVKEGSITNVFIVKNNMLYTPKTNILKGITRYRIIKLAEKEGLKVIECDFKISELLKADDVFLTNTKFGLVPVISVNRRKISNGKVGKISKQIMEAFNEYADAYFRKRI